MWFSPSILPIPLLLLPIHIGSIVPSSRQKAESQDDDDGGMAVH